MPDTDSDPTMCPTFEEVLLFLNYSDLGSRKDADAHTLFSDGLPMTVPTASANMDWAIESGKVHRAGPSRENQGGLARPACLC